MTTIDDTYKKLRQVPEAQIVQEWTEYWASLKPEYIFDIRNTDVTVGLMVPFLAARGWTLDEWETRNRG